MLDLRAIVAVVRFSIFLFLPLVFVMVERMVENGEVLDLSLLRAIVGVVRFIIFLLLCLWYSLCVGRIGEVIRKFLAARDSQP